MDWQDGKETGIESEQYQFLMVWGFIFYRMLI